MSEKVTKDQESPQDPVTGKFMPGRSGNPGGRPVKPDSLTAFIRAFGEKKDELGIEYRERLAVKLYRMAMDGNMRAAELVTRRCDGLLTQKIEQVSEVSVVYADDFFDKPGEGEELEDVEAPGEE